MKKAPPRILLFVLFIVLVSLLMACAPATESGPLTTTRPVTEIEISTTAVPTLTIVPTSLPTATAIPSDENSYAAYIQDSHLYIQDLEKRDAPLLVDTCNVGRCAINYLKWSPDGQQLVYSYYALSDDGTEVAEIRLANLPGEWQTVTQDVVPISPAAWSPDGRSLVYFKPTDETVDIPWPDANSSEMMAVPIFDVQTVAVADDGDLGEPQRIGSRVYDSLGCGGGGRSASEKLYDAEGGTAYGYLMAVLEWTAEDILLFTTNCDNRSIGRFDMQSGTELEKYETPMRNLIMASDKTQWYAVTGSAWSNEPGNNELVTGSPAETSVTIIPTSVPVEMIFRGNQTGQIYFTSREETGSDSFNDGSGPNFRFFTSKLWQLDANGAEASLIFEAADHAFAHVQETADGSLLFVRVENDTPFYEAVKAEIPEDEWPNYYPQRHILRLSPGEDNPLPWLENAGSITINRQ